MTIFFGVSDKDEPNFPKDQAELEARLAIIAKGLPQQGDNMRPFVMPAFKLFGDCGLINAENIKMLSEKWSCDRTFNLQMNPLGGVLRPQDLPMWDKTNLRYYSEGNTLFVEFKGVRYYISNDWFAPEKPRPTKQMFYEWLAKEARLACQKHWAQNDATQANSSINPNKPLVNNKMTVEVPISKIEELEKTIKGLCYIVTNLENKINNMNQKINDMDQKIDDMDQKIIEKVENWFNSK